MKYQLISIKEHPGHISAVTLAPVQSEPIHFTAGQYVELTCPDGSCLPYSIANAPNEHRQIELLLRHLPEDEPACSLVSDLHEKKIVEVSGPYGECVYRKESNKPLLFLAAGTGIAQIKSLVEQAVLEKDTREMHCYWGVRAPGDAFLRDNLLSWEAKLPDFQSQIIVSSENKQYVHDALSKHFQDLSGFQAYVSGSWPMVDATVECLLQLDMKKTFIYSDRFAFL